MLFLVFPRVHFSAYADKNTPIKNLMQDDMQDEKCNPAAKNGDGVFSLDNPVAIHQLIGAVPDIQDVAEDRAGQMTLDAGDSLFPERVGGGAME